MHFGWLYALAFIATLTHPALDWLNVYGVRLLEPFSSQWFYGDTLFIVDVWLWVLMGFACVFSLRREKRGGNWKRPARIALALALGYIGVNTVITKHHEDRGQLHALMEFGEYERNGDGLELANTPSLAVIASPIPFAFWKREIIFGENGRWLHERCWSYDDCHAEALALTECALPAKVGKPYSQLHAFLFWSRAPFAERAENGSVILRDARFYDPLVRDRFSVALPQVKCAAIAGE